MRVLDLTHRIHPAMPVYPGTAHPVLAPLTTLAEHGFAERLVTLATHTGTHMDAPAHILPGAVTLDQIAPDRFVGRSCVLDLDVGGPSVPRSVLETQAVRLRDTTIVLLRTGWSRHWGEPEYFRGFPTLAPDAAHFLVERGVGAVGIDAISFDTVDAADLPIHRILLGAGILLIENLTGLDLLPPAGFLLACLPLPLGDADGAPCRAVAVIDEGRGSQGPPQPRARMPLTPQGAP